jgi:hypothetical protein
MITSLHDAPAATNAYINILFNRLATIFRTGVSLSFTYRLIVNGFRPGKIRPLRKLHARQLHVEDKGRLRLLWFESRNSCVIVARLVWLDGFWNSFIHNPVTRNRRRMHYHKNFSETGCEHSTPKRYHFWSKWWDQSGCSCPLMSHGYWLAS